MSEFSGQVFIQGAWRDAAGTDEFVVFDSTTEEEVARVRSASAAQVDAAVAAARDALLGWRAVGLEARLELLRAVSDRLEEDAASLTDLLVREVGQVHRIAAEVQVAEPIAGLIKVAEHARAVRWLEKVHGSDVTPRARGGPRRDHPLELSADHTRC